MTKTDPAGSIHALLLGLSEDLAGELLKPLTCWCSAVQTVADSHAAKEASAADQVIFCGPDVDLVSELRQAMPEAPIVVVSRHPEVSGWLDSIEAGATDYCAAPFEAAQVKWILDTSLRSRQTA